MAKIVSHTWSSARGSIAGITYLTTPSGAIIARQRVKPVNPNSMRQVQTRNALASAATDWIRLTDAERETWDGAAGTTYTLLGRNMTTPGNGRSLFIKTGSTLNYLRSRGLIGTAFNGVAPNSVGVPLVLPEVGEPEGQPGVTGYKIIFTNPDQGRPVYVMIQVGYQVNSSRKYYRGPWRDDTLAVLAIDEGGTETYNMDYPAGALEGQRVYLRYVPFYKPEQSVWVGSIVGTPQIISALMTTIEA